MRVLQIANDFAGSKVHSNLVKHLDDIGISQIVYCPVREKGLLGNNKFDGKKIEFVYSHCIRPWYRYTYHHKVQKLYKDMTERIDMRSVDLIHAHTLFSDGALAYKAYKEFGIPYVVAVRNTDVNGFLKMLPNTWIDGIKILLHAKRIFFISQGLKRIFEQHFIIRPFLNKINSKFVFIPNGVDNYFHEHIYHNSVKAHKVIYIGDFSENKNVIRLCKAIMLLRKEAELNDTELTLVGGGHESSNSIRILISQHPESFKYLGKIYDKPTLCNTLRENSVFAMPSIYETFGLVYLEALSQNLPVLYTKGQGIDGLFDDSVGVAINPMSVEDITKGLRDMLLNRERYSNKSVDFSIFKWSLIAKRYIQYYKDCLK